MRPLVFVASSFGGRESVPLLVNPLSEEEASIVCVPHICVEHITVAVNGIIYMSCDPVDYARICSTPKASPLIISNEARRFDSISTLVRQASAQLKEKLILVISTGSGEDGIGALGEVITNGGAVFAVTKLPDIQYFQMGIAPQVALEMPNAAVNTGLDIGVGSVEEVVTGVRLHIQKLS